MQDARCDVELLGGLKVTQGRRVTTRFRTRQAAALWAYLSYHAGRPHPREVLINTFWPEVDDGPSGRNRLSIALSSLRTLFEPPGVPEQTVIRADRRVVEVNAAVVETDAGRFLRLLREADASAGDPERQRQLWEEAAAVYRGPLLPGFYEDWVIGEQDRLRARYVGVAVRLARVYEARGERDRAVYHLRLALAADPEGVDAMALLERLAPGSAARTSEPAPKRRRRIATREAAAFAPAEAPLAAVAEASPPAAPALPAHWNAFFGRDDEQRRLLDALVAPGASVVTLLGPGGVGKTRLALETARAAGDRFAAVFYVSLAEATDAPEMAEAIAEALQASGDGVDVLARSASRLRAAVEPGRRPLLVLDNAEQLIARGGADVVALLRQEAPQAVYLVTSRQRLGLPGERTLPLGPLPVPGASLALDPAALARDYPSVALFADRAREARPDFRLSARNAADVAALVARLNGLPLAVELAAARSQVMTPAQMARALADVTRPGGLDLAGGPEAPGQARHQSLRAALDWSYRLLSQESRRFFALLSVFHGGWTAEAAESVTGDPLALDRLAYLCDVSLVYGRDGGDGAAMRFFQLDTVCEFARERSDPAERRAAERRHLGYYAAFAAEAEPHLYGPGQGTWLTHLEEEYDNFRAALRLAATADEPEWREEGLRLAASLGRFWWLQGHYAEGRTAIERLLEVLPEHTPDAAAAGARAAAHLAAGMLARTEGDYRAAERHLKTALDRFRNLGDAAGAARSLDNLGLLTRRRGDIPRARALHEEALSLARAAGDRAGEARSLNNLGVLYTFGADDPAAAQPYYEQSLAIEREQGNPLGVAIALENLGATARRLGNYARARALYEEALALRKDSGAGRAASIAHTLHALGVLARAEGDYAEARRRLRESLRVEQEVQDRSGILRSLEDIASVAALEGQVEEAASLAGAASLLRETLNEALDPDQAREVEHTRALATTRLGESGFAAAYGRGRALSPEAAVRHALGEDYPT